jgi:transketolase
VALVGTGSEVWLCLAAADLLAAEGVSARVVSMPCFSWFDELDLADRLEVLPVEIPVLSVEAGTTFGWSRYADDSIGLDRFGASGPGPKVFEHFGFTAENVAARARTMLGTPQGPRRGRA